MHSLCSVSVCGDPETVHPAVYGEHGARGGTLVRISEKAYRPGHFIRSDEPAVWLALLECDTLCRGVCGLVE